MDFHCLTRKELQTLCKKNHIPANMTNVAMADALKDLTNVEGIEDIQQPAIPENAQPGSPEKPDLRSPDVPKTCRRTSTRRRPSKDPVLADNESKNLEESAQPVTRTRRGIAAKSSAVKRDKKDELNVLSEANYTSEIPQTPATHNGPKRAVQTSVRPKIETLVTEEKDEKENENPAGLRTYSTRRTTRLSAQKLPTEAVPSIRKTRGRKEAVKISALSEESEDDRQKKVKEDLEKTDVAEDKQEQGDVVPAATVNSGEFTVDVTLTEGSDQLPENDSGNCEKCPSDLSSADLKDDAAITETEEPSRMPETDVQDDKKCYEESAADQVIVSENPVEKVAVQMPIAVAEFAVVESSLPSEIFDEEKEMTEDEYPSEETLFHEERRKAAESLDSSVDENTTPKCDESNLDADVEVDTDLDLNLKNIIDQFPSKVSLEISVESETIGDQSANVDSISDQKSAQDLSPSEDSGEGSLSATESYFTQESSFICSLQSGIENAQEVKCDLENALESGKSNEDQCRDSSLDEKLGEEKEVEIGKYNPDEHLDLNDSGPPEVSFQIQVECKIHEAVVEEHENPKQEVENHEDLHAAKTPTSQNQLNEEFFSVTEKPSFDFCFNSQKELISVLDRSPNKKISAIDEIPTTNLLPKTVVSPGSGVESEKKMRRFSMNKKMTPIKSSLSKVLNDDKENTGSNSRKEKTTGERKPLAMGGGNMKMEAKKEEMKALEKLSLRKLKMQIKEKMAAANNNDNNNKMELQLENRCALQTLNENCLLENRHN